MWKNIRCFQDEQEHVNKFVFTKENAIAETVLYRYPDYKTRTVICCSVQSGCPVGCVFCGTGKNFFRSLNIDEICSQVRTTLSHTGIDAKDMDRLQIMFMSMGEPLLNKFIYNAIRNLHSYYPKAELLLSTIAPRLKSYDKLLDISKEIHLVGLQFSIHASTDEDRNVLIPFKKKLSLKEISRLGNLWHSVTSRPPFFNYCATVHNTTDDDAKRLLDLFDPNIWYGTISIICNKEEGKSSEGEEIAIEFANKLAEMGYSSRVFNPAGKDTIGGGCGQLWYVQKWMRNQGDMHGKSQSVC